jgi:hypothetical protein
MRSEIAATAVALSRPDTVISDECAALARGRVIRILWRDLRFEPDMTQARVRATLRGCTAEPDVQLTATKFRAP